MTIKSKKPYFKITKVVEKLLSLGFVYEAHHLSGTGVISYAKKIKIQIFSTPFDSTAVGC